MLVENFLEQSAEKFPEKEALVCDFSRLTFAKIESFANSLAQGLIAEGVKRQERVVVFLEPSVEAIVSIFAILKAGAIFVVLNPQIKSEKAVYILNDCEAKLLITDSNHLLEINDRLKDCKSLGSIVVVDFESSPWGGDRSNTKKIISYNELIKSFPPVRPSKCSIDIDLASLIYTSGTTGFPKGVMLTHLNIISAANSITQYLENTSADIILNLLPLSFDYGLYQVLMAFKFSGKIIQEKNFLYPYRIIELLLKEKVTGFPIVPTIAAILLRMKNLEKYDFPHLRYITSTAQVLPPNHIIHLQRIFPKAKIYSMYGLTECKRVSYLPPEELQRRPSSVGKPMPNTEVYLVDPAGRKIEEPHKIGELVVRGANVMKGYWNLPEETDAVLKPGPIPGEKVLYTGDLFEMDEEGFLYFVGRKDDLIKVGGERVSPKEVENVLHSIGGVSEAAVIGVEDEILGQAIKAFVVFQEGYKLNKEEIIKYCSRHMEIFMVPKYVEIVKELPKSLHGKVKKRELR